MKKLWIAFIVVATLGSIYPFNFQAAGLDVVTIGRQLAIWPANFGSYFQGPT